jgi:peptide/nickel transport system ATP-binding protein
MLKIRNLIVDYGEDRVLNGIGLQIEAGDSVALVGESGTGKTTLGRAIMGLCDGKLQGTIDFHGNDLLTLPAEAMRKIRWNQIAMVFQNVANVLNPVYRVVDQVIEPMVEHGRWGKQEARERAEKILEEVGLPKNRMGLYPHQISGGEQQRGLLAMALANDPELLILDEPLAALDETTRTQMTRYLRKIQRERNIALLIFTHDIATAVRVSNRFGSLYGGRILELGSSALVAQLPRHPYTRALIRSYPNMTTSKDLQGIPGRLMRPVPGCPFHPRCSQRIEICRTKTPILENHDGRKLACHRGGVIPVLQVKELAKTFNGFRAVDSVNLTLYRGETLALVGPSGSGKTTLGRLIMGFLEPTSGSIELEAHWEFPHHGFAKKVQMIFQNPGDSLSHRLKVLDLVKEPLDIQGVLSKEERIQKVRRLLEEVQLSFALDFIEKYPHQLSGGEQQRVAIARALALDPEVLIADEATSALDPSIQAKVLKLLLQIQESRGLSILFITHELAVARKISDRVAVMVEGKIVEEGPLPQVISNPQHPVTQALIASAPSLEKVDLGSEPRDGYRRSGGQRKLLALLPHAPQEP